MAQLLLAFSVVDEGPRHAADVQAEKLVREMAEKHCWGEDYDLRDAKRSSGVDKLGRAVRKYEVWGDFDRAKLLQRAAELRQAQLPPADEKREFVRKQLAQDMIAEALGGTSEAK